MDEPYFKGFEWDPETSYTKFLVHFQKEGARAPSGKKKNKKNAADDAAE